MSYMTSGEQSGGPQGSVSIAAGIGLGGTEIEKGSLCPDRSVVGGIVVEFMIVNS